MSLTEQKPLLELQNVSYRYSDGSRGLENCSLAIGHGSRTALLGANGAGKTTLFLHLNGILRPQSGQILCDGVPLDYSRKGLRQLRSRVGLVFQNPEAQLFSASIREDVSFGPMNLGLDQKIVRERVEEALAAVGLADIADKPVHNLSYGQKKRVCIAGVLAMRPEVIVLDEPMAGLDVQMQQELHTILDTLHAEGKTILVASHDMDFAYQWADRLLVMDRGAHAAGWDAAELLDALPQLAAFGIGVPRVAELHRLLLEIGMLEASESVPRCHEELAKLIRITSKL